MLSQIKNKKVFIVVNKDDETENEFENVLVARERLVELVDEGYRAYFYIEETFL